jgi:hypothetical protein
MIEIEDMTPEQKTQFIDRAVMMLSEVFPNVHISVSTPNVQNDGTAFIHRGCGDWFARVGLCHHFLKLDEASEIASRTANLINRPPEEGEEWKAK